MEEEETQEGRHSTREEEQGVSRSVASASPSGATAEAERGRRGDRQRQKHNERLRPGQVHGWLTDTAVCSFCPVSA